MKLTTSTLPLPPLDSSGRSSGIHLSQIIKFMMGQLSPARFSGVVDEVTRRRWEYGFAYEEMVGTALANRWGLAKRSGYNLQKEIRHDRVYMTPDAVLPGVLLEEYKATWMSQRRAITDKEFWHWFVQIKGYCYALGLTRARLIVWFINSDYKPPRPADPVVHTLRFTQSELDRNWQMILRYKKEFIRLSKGKAKVS